MPMVMARHFQEVVSRFETAMLRSLPHLGQKELRWRVELMFGGLSRVMWHRPDGLAAPLDEVDVLPRLVSFFGAAFRSPVLPKEEKS